MFNNDKLSTICNSILKIRVDQITHLDSSQWQEEASGTRVDGGLAKTPDREWTAFLCIFKRFWVHVGYTYIAVEIEAVAGVYPHGVQRGAEWSVTTQARLRSLGQSKD